MLLNNWKKRVVQTTRKRFTQNLAKNVGLSVYAGTIRKNKNEVYKCVTETWMREKFFDWVKEWFHLKNGNLIVKSEDDKCVDEYDNAKSVNIMHSYFGSYIVCRTKRLMNDVIKQRGGFYNNSTYYTNTDSLYIPKNYWSDLIDNGFVGKTLGLGKIYGNLGIIYAWFLAPKKKNCLRIDDLVLFWL